MSDDMKSLIKNFAILIVVLILTYFLANQFGSFYVYFFSQQGSGGGGLFSIPDAFATGLLGLFFSYIFFLTFFFTAFAGPKKYWWIGILLIPAAIFEFYFDLEHVYFPIAIGIAGWAIGELVLYITAKFLRQS